MDRPIEKAMIGQFCVGVEGETEEKFSDNVKEWIFQEGRGK